MHLCWLMLRHPTFHIGMAELWAFRAPPRTSKPNHRLVFPGARLAQILATMQVWTSNRRSPHVHWGERRPQRPTMSLLLCPAHVTNIIAALLQMHQTNV